jgi:hypothetical protein
MTWLPLETAPFDRDLELAIIDFDGAHSVAFQCRRASDGWISSGTGAPAEISPTHWRNWDTLESRDELERAKVREFALVNKN